MESQTVALLAVFMECSGILIAERRTALLLGLATILTIVILFMT